MSKIIFDYDENRGYTRCTIHYKNKTFIGEAFCASEDRDFQSEKTGCFIAEVRARLQRLKFIKQEVTTALSAMENFNKSLQNCKAYNKNSFEAKRIRKDIYMKRAELQEINNIIQDEQNYLQTYILNKEYFYQKQRARRGQNV